MTATAHFDLPDPSSLKISDRVDIPKFKPEEENSAKLCGFYLGKTIGEGAFGKVKLGYTDKTRINKVAIKILNRKKIKAMEVVGRVKREIRNLQNFQHPHIIKLHKCVSTPTEIFMIMEYAPGGDVFQYICDRGRLSENDSRLFFQQLISGVDYLHRNMVVHRDLKPENLLLDEPKRNLKIADFGLSRLMVDGNFMATSCGSPNYASPEVITANLYAGPEVDIWSCGVILYTFLCGTLPFDHVDVCILFKQIKSGKCRMPSFLTTGAREVLEGCLTVEPTKRWTVKELKMNSWFQEDMAAYLFAPVSTAATAVVNRPALLNIAAKFGCDEAEVSKSLLSGNPHDPKRIAYQILTDNQNIEKVSKADSVQSNPKLKLELDRRCLHACLGPGQKFCRPDCDMCPKWGAKECVFSKFIPDLSRCDTCVKHGDPGCIFSAEKLTESTGLKEPKMHRHMERIKRPARLSHTLKFEDSNTERMDSRIISEIVDFNVESQTKRALTKAYNYNHMVRKSKLKKARWHLGVRANCSPVDIMREIYRIMKKLDFEWRTEGGSPYRCVARKRDAPNSPQIQLQLYTSDSKDGHLLDFRSVTDDSNEVDDTDLATEAFEAEEPQDFDGVPNLSSETMKFFDLCAEIVGSLAKD